MTDQYKSRATTHADDCWSWGHEHYECAVRKIRELRADLMESDEISEKLGHLLTLTAKALKGEPPDGTWHSWHDLPEKATQLTESLRKLEERVQRDEELLRQALEALGRAHQTAMEQAMKARVLEGVVFAEIFQDLDFVVATLRERLGEKVMKEQKE